MPNTQRCFSCTAMKPCKCKGLLGLFKCRPFSKFFKYMRRTATRRRSTRRFRSIHAVFWPLMSMRSEDRERTVEHPSLTLTETETETVLRPVQVEPTPAPPSSSYVKVEPTPPPRTSSYMKIEPTPPLPPTSSSSYIKVKPTPPPRTSSYIKVEPTPPPATSPYTKIEPTPLPSSYTKVEPTPSPLTTSYTKIKPTPPPRSSSYRKIVAHVKKVEETTTVEDTEVQSACRIFEKYLMEMLIEERKIRDLLDVEELMSCMDKLKFPAFVELVCTFYGELCMDLFSNGGGDQAVHEAVAN